MNKIKFLIIIFLSVIAYYFYDHTAFKDLFESIFSIKTTYETKIEDYTIAIEQNPDDVWNYSFRGSNYMKIHKYDLALNDFNKAISLNNNFSHAYPEKSLALLCLGKYDEALKTINEAISEWPERISFYLIKGIIYDYKSKSIDAIKNYSAFLKCEETDDSKRLILFALKRRSICLYKLGKYKESYNDIEIVVQSQPNNKVLKEQLDALAILKNDNSNSVKLNENIQALVLDEAISVYLHTALDK